MNPSNQSRVKRPLWLKLLAFALLVLSLLGWMRFIESLVRWQEFIEAGMQPGPWYTAVSGLAVGGLTLTAAVGIWRRSRWAPAFTRLTIVLWLAWMWSDRIFVAASPNALVNWPFLAVVSVIIVFGVFFALHRGRNRFL